MTQTQPERPVIDDEAQYPLAPSKLAADVYRDEATHQLEIEKLFFEAWFPAVPSAEIAQPRQYKVWEQLEQSVVVIRLDDGTATAWYNVCQHRGARLLEGTGICPTQRIGCPWHGFGYELDGRVASVPLRKTFDPADLDGLRAPQVRSTEWGGWVWLTLSDTLPELDEYLQALRPELAFYDLANWKLKYRNPVVLNANWKITVDAFCEAWHLPFTHTDTLARMLAWRDTTVKLDLPHSWMMIPIRGMAEKSGTTDHHFNNICTYLSFPNTIYSCFPTHLQMWSVWPMGNQQCLLDAYGFVGPTPDGKTDEAWDMENDKAWEHFLHVFLEDSDIINGFAKVTRSKGYKQNLFNTAESRLTAFHGEIAKRLA